MLIIEEPEYDDVPRGHAYPCAILVITMGYVRDGRITTGIIHGGRSPRVSRCGIRVPYVQGRGGICSRHASIAIRLIHMIITSAV